VNEERLKNRWNREREARKSAEYLIETKSRELYDANKRYEDLIVDLENRVIDRTHDLEMAYKHFQRESKHHQRMERYKGTIYAAVSCLDSAESKEDAYNKILETICLGLNWKFGAVWIISEEGDRLVCSQTWYNPNFKAGNEFARISKETVFNLDQGLPGRVWKSARPRWINDVVKDKNFPRAPHAKKAELHGALSFPIRVKDKTYAIIEIFSDKVLDADNHLLELTGNLGLQIGQFVERLEKDTLFQRTHNILKAVSEMQIEYMLTNDIHYVLGKHLEVILKSTKCEFGFIAGVHKNDEDLPYIKTYAITDITWNHETRDFYKNNKDSGLEFYNMNTLFGSVVTTNEIVIANDPGNDPRAAGVPEGHPILNNFIGIPLKSGNKMVGLIALANRPEGFKNAFIEELEASFSAISQLIVSYGLENQRIASEDALRKSEEMFRSFLQNTPQATVIVNTQGKIEMVNEYALSLLGYDHKDLIGESIEMLVPASFRETHNQNVKEFLEHPRDRSMGEGKELNAVKKDGSLIPVEIGLSSISTSRGSRVIAVINDLTEQVAIREKILENLEEERRLGDLKSGFVSMASHEFKTPMAMILSSSSFLEMAEGKISGQDRLKKLSQIKHAVARMNGLLQNILTFSREDKKPLVNLAKLDLQKKIRECFELENEVRGAGCTLKLITSIPETPISIDENIFNQIFSNLVGNAIKYSPKSSVVEIDIKDLEQNYEITIRDYGMGIDNNHAELIFAPFHRGKGVDGIPGTGLGLTIVQRALESHGGSVSLQETVGEGSTFRVEISKNMKVN
jgi:PAS domain S-box-containing protein